MQFSALRQLYLLTWTVLTGVARPRDVEGEGWGRGEGGRECGRGDKEKAERGEGRVGLG